MKILDRYIIQSLFLSFFICMATIIGFFIIVHLFENFARFVTFLEVSNAAAKNYGLEQETLLSLIFFHYFHLTPLILYNFAPIITLIAAIFTVIRMVQSRELLLLQSVSISNFRIMVPFLVFASIISVGMVIMQETIIPDFSEEIIESNKIRRGRRVKNCFQYKDSNGKVFYIDEVNPMSRRIKNVRVSIFEKEKFKVIGIIEAQEGFWPDEEKSELLLLRGIFFNYKENRQQKIPDEGFRINTEMSIYRLLAPDKNLDILSTKELIALKKESNNIDIVIALYSKMVLPLSNIFILFLTVPIVLNSFSGSFFTRIGMCILLTSCFYAVHLACLNLGKKELITPLFASWFPLLLLISGGFSLFFNRD